MARSVLELVIGGVPFPHGELDGTWRYRHAVRPEGPSVIDHQTLSDFLAYENAHDRTVAVESAPPLDHWATWRPPRVRPNPTAAPIQCCTHAFEQGCAAQLVCHGTTPTAATEILRTGELLPSTRLTRRTAAELASNSTWGEPPDYFEHVMFAHGRCTAPEAVATSRMLGRDLVPDDLQAGYKPAVRFYIHWSDLLTLPNARFDGVHPIKTLGPLQLPDLLVAVVVHANDAEALLLDAPPWAHIIVLDNPTPTPAEWAAAALDAAQSMT